MSTQHRYSSLIYRPIPRRRRRRRRFEIEGHVVNEFTIQSTVELVEASYACRIYSRSTTQYWEYDWLNLVYSRNRVSPCQLNTVILRLFIGRYQEEGEEEDVLRLRDTQSLNSQSSPRHGPMLNVWQRTMWRRRSGPILHFAYQNPAKNVAQFPQLAISKVPLFGPAQVPSWLTHEGFKRVGDKLPKFSVTHFLEISVLADRFYLWQSEHVKLWCFFLQVPNVVLKSQKK